MKFKLILFVLFVLLQLNITSNAQTNWPSKPVRIVNPFTPGGAVDTVARALAQQLNEAWNQSVIVDNRPGAGTTIGMEIVVRAPPDGYTLLVSNGSVATVVPLYKKLSFNPVKDLAPISLSIQSPYLLGTHPSLKINNLNEFINYSKSRPDQLSYGSTGVGSLAHLTMELLKSHTKINMLHVAYKGGAPNITGLLGNEVQSIFGPVSALTPLNKSGKIKVIGITSAKRVELAPEVPTIAEQGIAGFEATSWYPVYAPANTPIKIIEKVNLDINKILQKPDVKSRFLAQGMVPVISTPEFLRDYLKVEIKRWSKVIQDSDIKPE
jgi:tripartite-type tricarboxylate transporter receptor subunit TctC